MANYNSATLTILSTPNGVLSDKTILFKRRIISKSKILNYTTEVSGDKNLAKMSKTFSFTAIDQPIKLKFIDLKLAKFKLDNVVFHKLSILKGFYRPGSSFNKISRRQYIRNRNIQTFYKAYITKSYTMYNSVIQIENHLKNLTFFKFKNFFSTSNYLTFRKSKNFVKCLHSINALEFYSIFYFIFYTKQLTFTGYRFRFSLYIKYLNHLIRVLHPMDLHRLNAQNKLNMGGEPLFYVR